jgi:hypothetical protein
VSHSAIVASFPVQAKIPRVIPANAGIQVLGGGVIAKNLDAGFRWHDGRENRIPYNIAGLVCTAPIITLN